MSAAVRFYDHSEGVQAPSMEEEIIRGLGSERKTTSPKYLYDQRGSQLFERICAQPEYYPTRTEEGILGAVVGEIAGLVGQDATLVEFGSGASRKVRLLLESMQVTSYLGIDISRDFLLESTRRLAADYPWLTVHAACADFSRRMELPEGLEYERLVGFFPGSSIGNFDPAGAEAFLYGLHSLLPVGSGLLIGVDLIKDKATLEAAYNDAAGVTADFNLNLLTRLQRDLGGTLDPGSFRHRAFYSERECRIEMHLVSDVAQTITLAGRRFSFRQGETIHTENSYKYSLEGFRAMAKRGGFRARACWTDERDRFSVHYLEAVTC